MRGVIERNFIYISVFSKMMMLSIVSGQLVMTGASDCYCFVNKFYKSAVWSRQRGQVFSRPMPAYASDRLTDWRQPVISTRCRPRPSNRCTCCVPFFPTPRVSISVSRISLPVSWQPYPSGMPKYRVDPRRPRLGLYTFITYAGYAKKWTPKCSTHNFVKYWAIFELFSLLQSLENLQCSSH